MSNQKFRIRLNVPSTELDLTLLWPDGTPENVTIEQVRERLHMWLQVESFRVGFLLHIMSEGFEFAIHDEDTQIRFVHSDESKDDESLFDGSTINGAKERVLSLFSSPNVPLGQEAIMILLLPDEADRTPISDLGIHDFIPRLRSIIYRAIRELIDEGKLRPASHSPVSYFMVRDEEAVDVDKPIGLVPLALDEEARLVDPTIPKGKRCDDPFKMGCHGFAQLVRSSGKEKLSLCLDCWEAKKDFDEVNGLS